MDLADKTKKATIGNPPKEVIIVVASLTQSEARQMFPYRPYNKYSESRFGGNELVDDFALILNGDAIKCPMCQAPTKNIYLSPYCPDCDGRSEYNGTDPRMK
jgi:hypothetical protein